MEKIIKLLSPSILAIYVNLLGLVNGVLVVFIITKFYSISFQSEYYLATALASWAILLDFGISQTLLYRNNNKNISSGVAWYIIFSFLIGISLASLYFSISSEGNLTAGVKIYFFIFLINTSLSIMLSFVRRECGEGYYWRTRSTEFSGYVILLSLFMYHGSNIYSLIYATCFSITVNIIAVSRKISIFSFFSKAKFICWRMRVLTTQYKVALEFISALVGIKVAIPLVNSRLGVLDTGKLGLTLTLYSIPLSICIALFFTKISYFSSCYLNHLPNSSLKKDYISFIMKIILLFVSVNLFVLSISLINEIPYLNIGIYNRVLDIKNSILIFLSNLITLGLVFLSSWLRINKRDVGWIFVLLFSGVQMVTFIISVSIEYTFILSSTSIFLFLSFLYFCKRGNIK